VFGVILGTGTGGGIIVDGQVWTGLNGIGGEWGHNPLPWPSPAEFPGPRCYCGKTGCIETFLSGPGLAADHEQVTGQRQEPAMIVAAATAGDPAAEATLVRYEDRLARSLAGLINVLDPEVIVLGGGLSNLERLYVAVPICGMRMSSLARLPPPWYRPFMATPVACVAQPGFGTPGDRIKVVRSYEYRTTEEALAYVLRLLERAGVDVWCTGNSPSSPLFEADKLSRRPRDRRWYKMWTMSRTTLNTRAALDHAIAELLDLPYSFWRTVVTERSSFSRPLPTGSGRLDVDASWHAGSHNIQVTIAIKRGWRRRVSDGFIITPTNKFR